MRHHPNHWIRFLLFGLAGYAIYLSLSPVALFGEEPTSQVAAPPKIDHILLEVSDLNASIAFYRDFLGLRLKSQSDWFVTLESTKYLGIQVKQQASLNFAMISRGTSSWCLARPLDQEERRDLGRA